MSRWRKLHLAVSVLLAVIVPLALYLNNGTLELWMLVLGAVVGFMYWFSGRSRCRSERETRIEWER